MSALLRAERTSWTVWNRASGRFARHFRQRASTGSGRPGRRLAGETTGVALMTSARTSGSLRPTNGWPTGQEREQDRPDAVDVRAVIDRPPAAGRLLGGHERRGPLDLGRPRRLLGEGARQAEVRDPDPPALVEQQVGRLEVAMDDPPLVRMPERIAGLHRPFQLSRKS